MDFITSFYPAKHKCALLISSWALWLPICADEDPKALSEPDRIAVEAQLEKIEQLSEERVGGLYRRAITDYRSAIQSDSATMELYLKCIEKVQYTDQQKKASEFREWKRNNKERLGASSFKMALRHQLSWLLLSIEAADSEDDLSKLGPRAITHLNQIFQNAETLKPHRRELSKNVLSSVFAQAYSLNIKVKDWPSSALEIGRIYDKVVMPPLRNLQNIADLRRAWDKRISHEAQVFEKWHEDDNHRIGTKDSLRSPEFEKFLAEKRPELLWEMELDCFDAGDEQGAAVKMLKHLETHITHKQAPKWIKDLKKLITPEGAQ